MDYRLVDAEALAEAEPESLSIPARDVREGLWAGDLVKLGFDLVDPPECGPFGERMWVQVTSADAEGRYVGQLDNTPSALGSLRRGDPVAFGPEHVMAVWDESPQAAQVVWVSRRLHEQNLRPGFVARTETSDEADSGWSLLVSDETDAELDDPENVLLQPWGYVVSRWPVLAPVLSTGEPGGGWVWDDEQGAYRALTPPEGGHRAS
ncbi:DUF2185 domain-containing protein [Arsenicicoccus dermatophilus]|uniref:immunity protein Imm33 domain-containing protein n=1 Tax=Arsenicicoccus dermatophilus TaxID=1076331 RepID=UPI0039172AAA